MNALGDWWDARPASYSAPPTRIHVWRADPYRTSFAPQSGWYAIGRRPAVFLHRGEPLRRTIP